MGVINAAVNALNVRSPDWDIQVDFPCFLVLNKHLIWGHCNCSTLAMKNWSSQGKKNTDNCEP